MNSTERCPTCDGPLTPTTGQPMCPACLMRGVLEPTDSELASRFLSETRSLPGDKHFDSMQSVGATAPFADLDPGARMGDYRIVRRLGRGGMGVVYEAEHLPTSRRVALKVLAQSLDQPEARARFLREGRLAASINHPNSVYVYGTEEIDGVPTISMELVDGGTLAEHVKRMGPMSIRSAVDAVIQIIDGLAAADERGVLHRDVKPSNCFVAADGTVKVGDFGLSISTTGGPLNTMSEVTIEGTFLGTPAFASPEQLRGEPLDRRSDIYSVGVTLFYLLTGEVPFDADNMIHLLATVLDKPAPSASTIRREIPAELNAVIARCLQKPQGGRFENYDALRAALKPFSSQSPVAASLGDRTLAGIVDAAICWFVLVPVSFISQYRGDLATDFGPTQSLGTIALGVLMVGLTIAYYAVAEWKYGYTIGKKLFSLRVTAEGDRPTLSQTIGRAFLYLGVPIIPSTLFNLFYVSHDSTEFVFGPAMFVTLLVGWSYLILKFGLFVTARSRNGYAAIHDRMTSTRVLQRVPDVKRITAEQDQDATERDSFNFDPNAATIGPYHKLQTVLELENEQLILGYDARLLRRVWLHVQPIGTSMVPATVRNSTSQATLRWLGGRRSETECWDCYEAPTGQSLIGLLKSVSCARAIRVMRRLVQLLTEVPRPPEIPESGEQRDTSPDVAKLPTLRQLWVTDLDELKRLPFEMSAESATVNVGDDANVPESSQPDAEPLQLIRRAASIWLSADHRPASNDRSWSLSQYNAMLQVADADEVGSATQILHSVDPDRGLKLRSRVLGVVAISLALPLMTVMFGLFAAVLYQSQKDRYPEIDQLHEVAQVLAREERLLTAERIDRVVAVQRHVAGNFAHVMEDKDAMNSIYAITRLTPADRMAIGRAIDSQQPTPDEVREATAVYQALRQDWLDDPGDQVQITFSFWTALGPAYTWLEFIWFPSLFTGLLFRGGLLIRMFGLVLVNRRGKRASGLRVFIRMFFSGILVLAIAIVGAAFHLTLAYWSPSSIQLGVIVSLVVVAATMVVVPIYRGNQCLSDRFAGTYFVVK
ncbi:protein kinase domain-containing protein [Planctomycetes bacterium TBK1r]|uniref:Serine/threonine-protein kinase PrkC n=1 Tax=Stieleria magnilauensis TaxID=2527963 RepID=A0ABX5XPX1_9BACT|nr:Serine/threonine-protein kinase PrkC [Planctomycetes bacterium TBK1r]